jgi:hypothetical protein
MSHPAVYITTSSAPVVAPAARPTVSSRYSFIPTNEIVGALESRGWVFDAGTARRTRKEELKAFAHHVLRFSNPGLPTLPDGSRPQAVILNSHGGGGCFEVSLGFFRAACANGLVVQDSFLQTIRLRHFGLDVPKVLDGVGQILDAAPAAVARTAVWSKIILPDREQEHLARKAALLRWGIGADVDIRRLAFHAARPQDRGNDLWTVFNRIQEKVLKGGVKVSLPDAETGIAESHYRGRRASAIKNPVIDLKLNRGLWELAECFATAA